MLRSASWENVDTLPLPVCDEGGGRRGGGRRGGRKGGSRRGREEKEREREIVNATCSYNVHVVSKCMDINTPIHVNTCNVYARFEVPTLRMSQGMCVVHVTYASGE